MKVFYSWQTDSPNATNRGLIEGALLLAKTQLLEEGQDDRPQLEIDQATSREPGSPDIPATIFRKISEADALIADITTIGKAGDRPTPNPNVLIELGYAIGILGWSRIILVFNTAHGEISTETPFDIAKQRIRTYECHQQTPRRTAREQLGKRLAEEIKLIFESNPPLPNEFDTETVQRQRDLRSVIRVLESLPLEVIKQHAEYLPDYVRRDSFTVDLVLESLTEGIGFYIYDESLREALYKFTRNLRATLRHGKYYTHDNGGQKMLGVYADGSPEAQKELRLAREKILEEVENMLEGLYDFLTIVRANYPEIDVDQITSQAEQSLREAFDLARSSASE